MTPLLTYEPAIRLVAFLVVLVAMALWEMWAPRRHRELPRLLRWSNNLGVMIVGTLLVRLSFPVLALGLAIVAQERGWGFFNIVSAPGWVALVVSVLVLDAAIYFQHVMFHAVPALWRLHRMHHADLEFDVSTGVRFHPVEILLSMAIKLAVVAALGPPAVAVLIFEVLLNATSMFNHSNVAHSASHRPHAATRRRDARHAPGASLESGCTRPTATSASTCRGGTGCSGPTATSLAMVTRG